MKCKFKNCECEHAGRLVYKGCKELGDSDDDFHECTVCYNDEIGRDVTKCKK